jgi:hypothetical protein
MHSPILLGLYNGNPAARVVTGLVDGLLAHGQQGRMACGISPMTSAGIPMPSVAGDGGGASLPMQSAWAAWRFGRTTSRGPCSGGWCPAIFGAGRTQRKCADRAGPARGLGGGHAQGQGGNDVARFEAWNSTGDKAWLAALNAAGIADKAQHMFMITRGNGGPTVAPALQRERLGGIALKRNQTWPGNAVSWRFADPQAAVEVAILVRDATPEHFTVIAHNTRAVPVSAQMGTWNVVAGRWTMTQGWRKGMATRRRGRLPRARWPSSAADRSRLPPRGRDDGDDLHPRAKSGDPARGARRSGHWPR